MIKPEERFWCKVKKTSGCWLWTASLNNKGYGQFSVGGRRKSGGRLVLAHRFSWELHNGPIPDELDVLHECDNPPCVRPDHLFLGMIADNNEDMRRKGRGVNPPQTQVGERHHKVKLTEQQVREIRSVEGSCSALGRKYGVSKVTIWNIRKRRIWRSVE